MPSLPNLQVNTPSHYPQPLAISIDGGKTWIAPYEPLAEGTRFLVGIGFKNSGSAASNVTYQVTLDGELFYSGTKNSVSSGTSWNYNYGTFSLNPGTHELVLTIDPGNNIQESDESDNTFSYTITVAGSTDWLVKYYWSQDDPLFGTNVTINAYMPLDPKTGKRCLTGCTNTATALVLSYFASRGYNFTVDLTASDAFTSGGRITIDGTEKNAAANGTLSFAEINELLEEYDPDSPEDVAALCFASGVIAQATFGSSATSTALSNKVILRGGFKSASAAYMYNSDFWTGKKLSDKGWEMLIRNMEKEKPVLASIENPSHAIVVDGYDAQTDKIHLNYGWGSYYTKKYNSSSGVYEGTGWYTRQECDALRFNGFIYDITPDTTAPAAGEITCRKYKGYAELSPSFSDDVEIWKSYYRLGDSGAWEEYTDSVRIDQNCIVYFKACDRAKNYSEESSFVVYGFTGNHESIQPLTITVNAETNGITAGPVTITLDSSGGLGDISYYYKIDSGSWQSCSSQLSVSANGEVSFYARDIAGNQTETVTCHVGNIDCLAPEVPDGFQVQQSGSGVYIEWEDVTDQGVSGFSHYLFRYGQSALLTGNGDVVSQSGIALGQLAVGGWYYQVKGVDAVGNSSAWSPVQYFSVGKPIMADLKASASGLSWNSVPGIREYVTECTFSGGGTLRLTGKSNAVDIFALPGGISQWQVSYAGYDDWSKCESVNSSGKNKAENLVSDNDGDMDLFFANPAGVWEKGYAAEHSGILGTWQGTGEKIFLDGKNKMTDIFTGSRDANVLVLTDSSNGDALFSDDIFSAFPGTGSQSRILNIDKIRAGAGNDIVDLTSQRYMLQGSGVTVYGGLGDDVIWAGKGNNILFGDGGNDLITGGSGNDVIAGGSGNDRMHGGGGSDIFTFCANWGNDTVEQLSGGSITLWFDSGSLSGWNEETKTYTRGSSSVTVLGDAEITLKFGDLESLDVPGAFAAETSRKIFEAPNSGMLA